MVAMLFALLLQAPSQAPSVQLPVSLERVREGLTRKPQFEIPAHSPWAGIFRVKVEGWVPFEHKAWAEPSVEGWIRSAAPQSHVDFLQTVTPEHFRASTMYPCCNVMPVLESVTHFVRDGVRAIRQARAKREVEQAMKAAGIVPR
jgi:hypothetical protein